MKKIALLTGLVAVALFLGVAGTSLRTNSAQADATDILAINPDVCMTLTGTTACYALDNPGALAYVADVLDGDVDDPETWADLAAASAAQLGQYADTGQGGQSLFVLVFVTNDLDVLLETGQGYWVASGEADVSCSDMAEPDDDCDDDGSQDDSVVVHQLFANGNKLHEGPAEVSAQQGTSEAVFLEYDVVGAPDEISLTALKETIQEWSDYSESDCDVSDFGNEMGRPNVAGLLAEITDEEGIPLAGIWVVWESDDDDVVDLSVPLIATMAVPEISDDAIYALNLACGDEIGIATVTAAWAEDADDIDDEVDIEVIGAPDTIVLTAAPASALTCNGTAESVVSVTVKDADGNPVVAGNKVRFDVVALATATPIIAETDANGVATSKIVPLSGTSQGVTVIVTVLGQETDDETFATDLQSSIRVDCAAVAPVVVPPVAPPVLPPVVPPGTGDAGLLD